ncbi:MAG TPA: FAD binding domain-containing protein [Pirellulales bacterium]|jgi:xanthine dehydrogenase YagS FAD-binding subunit|nr:FAD binding domain-containing protein [Pirellulales bacterium]
MKAFDFASPVCEADVLELLSGEPGQSEILAGGTDLVPLMKKMLVAPDRVVNIMEVDSLRGVSADSQAITIGATTTLDDVLEAPELDDYPAIKQAIRGINAMQLQGQGTIGGELCQRPRCWYFRNGHGLLANRGRLVTEGDNRYHAIFANDGPAKFVHPSRIAPALVALGATLRIVGPGPQDETLVPIGEFFHAPRHEGQREHVLAPNQLLTHVLLPPADGVANATYEVRHGEGPDYPLAAAAVALQMTGGIVTDANVVLGHTAPTPWISQEASQAIIGWPVNAQTARAAGEAAVARATPLKDNEYKVQLAAVAVERALLLAAGFPLEGF